MDVECPSCKLQVKLDGKVLETYTIDCGKCGSTTTEIVFAHTTRDCGYREVLQPHPDYHRVDK